MVMNNEVKKYLADTYFAGRIPGNLVRYLYDRYGEDPLEGELSPQFFWSFVISDVEAYIHGSLDITLRTPIQKLQDRYKDLESITIGFAEDIRNLELERSYLRDFISYIHKEDFYQYFREHAHQEKDELDFTYYTL